MYVEYGDRNAQKEKTRVQSKWADKNDGQEWSCLVNWFVFYDFFLAVRKEDKMQTCSHSSGTCKWHLCAHDGDVVAQSGFTIPYRRKRISLYLVPDTQWHRGNYNGWLTSQEVTHQLKHLKWLGLVPWGLACLLFKCTSKKQPGHWSTHESNLNVDSITCYRRHLG